MTDPARAARLWLAVAVATLWLLAIGGEADPSVPESTLLDVSAALPDPAADNRGGPPPSRSRRRVSLFRRGWVCWLVTLINGDPLPLGRFIPEPWPRSPTRSSGQLAPPPPQLLLGT